MTEKTVRPQQQSLRFSILEPACRACEIHIELERVAADDHRAGIAHLEWRIGETSQDELKRWYPSLLELCLPQRVETDNSRQRKGASGDGRR